MSSAKHRPAYQAQASVEEWDYASEAGDAFVYAVASSRYQFARQFLDRGAIAFDIGCGPGYGTNLLAEIAGKVYGLDFNKNSIEWAKEHHTKPNIEFHCGDALQFNLPESEADLITCFELIEHVESPETVIDQCLRHVKPGGYAVFSTPNKLVHMMLGVTWKFHVREYGYSELLDMFGKVADPSRVRILGQNPNAIAHIREKRGRFLDMDTPFRRGVRMIVPRAIVSLVKPFSRQKMRRIAEGDPDLREATTISEENIDVADTFIIVVQQASE